MCCVNLYLTTARAFVLEAGMCVRVCVCPPFGLLKPLTPEFNKSYCFSVSYKALAIDTIDGRGLSKELRRELLPKRSKVTRYLLFITR